MKKYLLKIKENLKADLYSYTMAIRNNLCESVEQHKTTLIGLANYYLLSQEIQDIIHCLDLIQKDCTAEINGTFFQDRVLPFSDLEGDEELFYDRKKHNPFINLLETLHDNSLVLSTDLKEYIQSYALRDYLIKQKMHELFPVTIINQNGSRISKGEMMQGSLQKNYATEINILEGFEPMVKKLDELANAMDPDSLIDILLLIA